MTHEVPKATDVLIHAGDFSMTGTYEELQNFRSIIEQQPQQQKLVIDGNHDITMHPYITWSLARVVFTTQSLIGKMRRNWKSI